LQVDAVARAETTAATADGDAEGAFEWVGDDRPLEPVVTREDVREAIAEYHEYHQPRQTATDRTFR
jgi:hypothetical protein